MLAEALGLPDGDRQALSTTAAGPPAGTEPGPGAEPALQARVLDALGTARHGLGDREAAVDAWARAHARLTEFDAPEAGEVAERLRVAGHRVPGPAPDATVAPGPEPGLPGPAGAAG